MMDNEFPLQAAICVPKDKPVDEIFEAVARLLKGEGMAVIGFLQREGTSEGECCNEIRLEDIVSGRNYVISQALGSGARGCRLDPQALTEVAGLLLSGLEGDPHLLILNRFGKGESEGQGFRAAIEDACTRGIPVLTAVRESYFEAWTQFSGDLAILLAPEYDQVIGWVRQAITAAGRFRDAA